jgi:hypothetical protein
VISHYLFIRCSRCFLQNCFHQSQMPVEENCQNRIDRQPWQMAALVLCLSPILFYRAVPSAGHYVFYQTSIFSVALISSGNCLLLPLCFTISLLHFSLQSEIALFCVSLYFSLCQVEAFIHCLFVCDKLILPCKISISFAVCQADASVLCIGGFKYAWHVQGCSVC